MKTVISQETLSETEAVIEGISFAKLINDEVMRNCDCDPNAPLVEIVTSFGDTAEGIRRFNYEVDKLIIELSGKGIIININDIIFISDGKGKLYAIFVVNPSENVKFQFIPDNGYMKVMIIYRQIQE
jgi:hypothetical protein